MSGRSNWLSGHEDDDDPTGDLARDARDDPVGMIAGWVGPSRSWMRDKAARDAYDDAADEHGHEWD